MHSERDAGKVHALRELIHEKLQNAESSFSSRDKKTTSFKNFSFRVDIDNILVHAGLLFWHFLFFWQFAIYFAIFCICFLIEEVLVAQLFVVGLATLYLSSFWFCKVHLDGGHETVAFVQSFICQYPMKWFPMTIQRTQKLPSEKQHIFALHPHGLMPWGLFPVGRSKQWTDLFPGIKIRCLAADALFKIPIAREATILAGGVSAGFSSADKVLSKGLSVGVLPGGSLEMLEAMPESNEEILVLKERRGFIRLALLHGADVVPCYCFGVTDLYNQVQKWKALRAWLIKKTRFGFAFGWGRYFYNLLPAKRPIVIVVGKPIHVEKCENPTDEQVNELHAKYVKKLTKLYEKHKGQVPGYENRELVIQ